MSEQSSEKRTRHGQSPAGLFLTLCLGFNAMLIVLTAGNWATDALSVGGFPTDLVISFAAALSAIGVFRWRILGDSNE